MDFVLKSATHNGYDGSNLKPVNQDSSLVLVHPSDNRYKFMVVADGIGGSYKGEIASSFFCKRMGEKFEELPGDVFCLNLGDIICNVDKDLFLENRRLVNLIPQSNSGVRKSHIPSLTVGSVVAIGPSYTKVSTVGDTRVYVYKNGVLSLIHRIENLYDKFVSLGYADVDLRLKAVPEGCIGYGINKTGCCEPDCHILNNDYDGILVVSDGVYKFVDLSAMDNIMHNCISEDVADVMVNMAAHGVNFSSTLSQDNITAAYFGRQKILK